MDILSNIEPAEDACLPANLDTAIAAKNNSSTAPTTATPRNTCPLSNSLAFLITKTMMAKAVAILRSISPAPFILLPFVPSLLTASISNARVPNATTIPIAAFLSPSLSIVDMSFRAAAIIINEPASIITEPVLPIESTAVPSLLVVYANIINKLINPVNASKACFNSSGWSFAKT